LERRVVVTGVGTVNPLGHDVATPWEAKVAGVSGIRAVTLFDATGFPARIAGEAKGFDANARFGTRRALHLDRFAQFALAATTEAMEMAKLDVTVDPWRVGVVYGTALRSLRTLEEGLRTLVAKGPGRVSPDMSPNEPRQHGCRRDRHRLGGTWADQLHSHGVRSFGPCHR